MYTGGKLSKYILHLDSCFYVKLDSYSRVLIVVGIPIVIPYYISLSPQRTKMWNKVQNSRLEDEVDPRRVR